VAAGRGRTDWLVRLDLKLQCLPQRR
jgi:hypothetical protein